MLYDKITVILPCHASCLEIFSSDKNETRISRTVIHTFNMNSSIQGRIF